MYEYFLTIQPKKLPSLIVDPALPPKFAFISASMYRVTFSSYCANLKQTTEPYNCDLDLSIYKQVTVLF